MRRSLLLLLIVCSVYGWGVYQLKYRVVHLESTLNGVKRQMIAEKESIHILRAEISYVTRPEQVAKLSAKYLDLSPINVAQIYALSDVAPNVAYSHVAKADTAKGTRGMRTLVSSNTVSDETGFIQDDVTTPDSFGVE